MRRPQQFMAESYRPSIDIAAGIAATATVWAWTVGTARALHIVRAVINATATITASATDYWVFQIKNSSTVMASWSTQTTGGGGNGTLTANTPVEMVLAGTDAALSAFAGNTITIVVTKVGAPSAAPAFNILPEGSLF